MHELMPWMFLFFIPAVTMRSLAEDTRSGTIEIVLAQPLTELSYLLGKFFGQVLFVWVALALTLAVPLGLSVGADMHVGVVFAQYVGAALLAAGLCGIGVWASSLTRNQITAFIVAVTVMFLLVLIGLNPLLLGLPLSLTAVAARLGVLSHFRDIARGVIDLRDVIYFVTLAAIFLTLAYGAIMRRKLSPQGHTLRRLRLGVTIIVLGCVVINLFGHQIGGRLDLTPGNAYTLSPATRDLLGDLDDIVTLKLFASEELPTEVALLRRDIDDLLRDYRSAGDGNVRLVQQDPADDPEADAEARSLGIPPVQFNVVGETQFSVRDGYLGLAVQYADQNEVIPFIQRTEDLEYRLTSFIRGMTDTTRTAVGFYVDPSETRMPQASFNELRRQLSQSYDVRTLSLSSDTVIPDDMQVAVLIGSPDSLSAGQREQMAAFFNRGGSAFIAAAGNEVPQQQQFAMGRDVSWNAVLEPYGVSIRSEMVYDLIANERVRMQTQFGFQVLRPYPLYLRGVSTQASVINQGIEGVSLPYASTIDTSSVTTEGVVTPLIMTSEAAGVESNAIMLDPTREFPQDSLRPRVLAVQVNPLAVDEPPDGPTGRVVVVGNAQFLMDQFAGAQANLAFGLNAVDWLAQDEALISIRAKDRTPPTLRFSSEAMSTMVRYFNVFGVPILVILAGVLRLLKRKQRTRQRYQVAVQGVSS
jgi:ABC-type uncharacterized transport system involved in gliding motility auxiliary subunit